MAFGNPALMSTSEPGRALWIIWSFCGLCGVIAWLFYVWVFHGDPGQDWMVFYTASSAWFDGNLPLIFDGEKLTAALNQRFADWLMFPLNLHPWVYPPTFLLLFLPFGALPPVVSIIAFVGGTFALLVAAVWMTTSDRRARVFLLCAIVLCPATPFNVMTGQNAFLTGALFLAGFGLLARSPFAAGLLLGLLSVKPQFALMVPVALLAMRQKPALAGAAVSAIGLALLSAAVFGLAPWRAWFEIASGATEVYRSWAAAGRINGLSVFACARLLGAPESLANIVQVIAIAVAAAAVYWTYRRPAPAQLQLSVLLAATMLAAPHASASDAVLLALATALFFTHLLRDEFAVVPALLAAAVWICPLFNPPSLFRAGLTTPVLLLMFIAVVMATIRALPHRRLDFSAALIH